MKKELIIYFSKFSVGGMERSLVEFLKNSNLNKNYNITVYVGYSLENSYLEEARKYANIELICKGKWNLLAKIKTFIAMEFKYIKYLIKKPNYDVSICYPHQHKILAKLARISSKNNIIFIHADLVNSRNEVEREKLLNKIKFEKFAKIACVSEKAKESFLTLRPNYKGKIYVINNYANGEYIISKSNEVIDDFEFKNKTFINISRQVEKTKQISMIIEAAKKLVEENYKFDVLLLGNGPDHNYYKELIDKYNLKNIYPIGTRLNPYKYLKKADCLLLTSKFEGYGMVLDEARILNVPIISTNVGNASNIIKEGYGILADNNIEGIYNSMKEFLDKGIAKKEFNYKEFNQNITDKINEMVSDKYES